MKNKKVYISTSSFGEYDREPIEFLGEFGLDVVLNPYGRKLTELEIKTALEDVDYLIAGTEPITAEVLNSAKKLKVVSRCGTGMDNIDLVEAEKLGIKTCNTPYGPTLAVAELTVALIISLMRKINYMDRKLRAGQWQKCMGNLLYNKKIGIIGFGKIGQGVAKLLIPFGVQIRYFDIDQVECEFESKKCDLKALLVNSDILSIHISSASKTLIGIKELKLMKQKSWLINMSRGGVVDESALYKALKEEWICGAALDVFNEEPYEGKLSTLDNIIVTPHIGSYAIEGRQQMEKDAVENLINLIKKRD